MAHPQPDDARARAPRERSRRPTSVGSQGRVRAGDHGGDRAPGRTVGPDAYGVGGRRGRLLGRGRPLNVPFTISSTRSLKAAISLSASACVSEPAVTSSCSCLVYAATMASVTFGEVHALGLGHVGDALAAGQRGAQLVRRHAEGGGRLVEPEPLAGLRPPGPRPNPPCGPSAGRAASMAAITASACAWVIVPFSTSGARISCSHGRRDTGLGCGGTARSVRAAGRSRRVGCGGRGGLRRGSAAPAGEDQARSAPAVSPARPMARQIRAASSSVDSLPVRRHGVLAG